MNIFFVYFFNVRIKNKQQHTVPRGLKALNSATKPAKSPGRLED
jgi:hypothetical protein